MLCKIYECVRPILLNGFFLKKAMKRGTDPFMTAGSFPRLGTPRSSSAGDGLTVHAGTLAFGGGERDKKRQLV